MHASTFQNEMWSTQAQNAVALNITKTPLSSGKQARSYLRERTKITEPGHSGICSFCSKCNTCHSNKLSTTFDRSTVYTGASATHPRNRLRHSSDPSKAQRGPSEWDPVLAGRKEMTKSLQRKERRAEQSNLIERANPKVPPVSSS